MLTPRVRVSIQSKPTDVYRVLCDFKNYTKWNPCITIEGQAVADTILTIKPRKLAFWISTHYRLEILNNSHIALREEGKFSSLIHTRREMILYTKSDASTIFSSKLYLQGWIAPLAAFFYGKRLINELKMEALALKRYCETLYQN